MYKLLTTAAVIMAVATPSIANQWTGHSDLVQKLEQTYGHLDGGTQFDALEGAYDENADIGAQTGQLSNFFGTVDKGVTYITLNVDPDTNAISAGINKGVAFSEITAAKDELVNRVNYDLFTSTTDEAVTGFDKGQDYTNVRQQNLTLTGTPENSSDNDYVSNHNGGLAGVKITGLVNNVNTINEFLIASDTTATQSKTFQDEFDAGSGTTAGVEIGTVFSTITSLNSAIALGQDNADGTGNFFGNIGLGAISETNINDFAIPAYNSFDDIGNAGSGNYGSISDWAYSIQTVEIEGTEYNFAGTNTIVVDGATVTVDGTAVADVSADSRFTAK